MSFLAIGVTIAGAAASYGIARASTPQQPNLAASSRELADTQARLLPLQRAMQSMAQQGKAGWIDSPTTQWVQIPASAANDPLAKKFLSPEQLGGLTSALKLGALGLFGKKKQRYEYVPYDPTTMKELPAGATIVERDVPGKRYVDFRGIGTADVEGAVARELAKSQLALAQKYDAQFIEEALRQQKLADPEGFAARQKMSDLIQEQIARPLNSPVSELLNEQVTQQVNAARAGTLTAEEQAILDQSVQDALRARGGAAGTAGDFTTPLTTGFAGEGRRAAAARAGTAWLASGQTPEDLAYRREQQNLANLSAEVTGQTPTSQFGQLRNAQAGPTPVAQAQPLAQLPGNLNQTANAAAIGRYGAQIQQAGANWFGGLSALLSAANAAGNAGWQPGRG